MRNNARKAVCFCGFTAVGPWYKDEAQAHANDLSHGVDIVEGDYDAPVTVVTPEAL